MSSSSGTLGGIGNPMNEWRVAVFASVLILVGCGRSETAKPNDARREADRAAAITALAQKHGADVEWRKPFDDPARFLTYTYELQKSLVRTDERAVILIGDLDDIIALENGQYEIRGHESLTSGPEVYFSLKCAAAQLTSVLTRAPDVFDEYAFVARIERVSRPMLQASAESHASDDVRVVIEPSRMAVAIGKCLEVVHLRQ